MYNYSSIAYVELHDICRGDVARDEQLMKLIVTRDGWRPIYHIVVVVMISLHCMYVYKYAYIYMYGIMQ